MLYLIVSLISLFAGFAGARYLVRRHHSNVLFQMQQQAEALRTIMYRTHHHGVNPICKRIRGITGLGRILIKRSPASSDQEINMILDMIDNQALELETEMLNKVKEFEHLQ
jgi:hypothetical protein